MVIIIIIIIIIIDLDIDKDIALHNSMIQTTRGNAVLHTTDHLIVFPHSPPKTIIFYIISINLLERLYLPTLAAAKHRRWLIPHFTIHS